jgi:hypothetical protein
MKEAIRKIAALTALTGVVLKLPAWAILSLADGIRRAGDSEDFHKEIARLQQKGYSIRQHNIKGK